MLMRFLLCLGLLMPVAAQALPSELAAQVRRGNLTYTEAQSLADGIYQQRGRVVRTNPADEILSIYIAQLRTPGLGQSELTYTQQQAMPFLTQVSSEKLREYQSVIALALNQSRSNQIAREQYQEATTRETRRQELLREEERERFAREALIFNYGNNVSSFYRPYFRPFNFIQPFNGSYGQPNRVQPLSFPAPARAGQLTPSIQPYPTQTQTQTFIRR